MTLLWPRICCYDMEPRPVTWGGLEKRFGVVYESQFLLNPKVGLAVNPEPRLSSELVAPVRRLDGASPDISQPEPEALLTGQSVSLCRVTIQCRPAEVYGVCV